MAVTTPTKVSARQALRARIQARSNSKVAVKKVTAAVKKFATLRRLALEEPQEVGDAIGQLAEGFGELKDALQSFAQNLDVAPIPATASLKTRIAAKKNFGSRLRRIAEEAPQQMEMAYNELYTALDGLAEDMEVAAENMGITLQEPMDEIGGPVPEEGGNPFGGESESEPAEKHEDIDEHIEEHEDEEPEEVKESSGSDWFVSDGGSDGKVEEPKTARRKSVVSPR